jgi:hypothetical protein
VVVPAIRLTITLRRQRLSVLADEREQAVFNLVPFAGARWKVADGNREAGLVGQPLQLQFP